MLVRLLCSVTLMKNWSDGLMNDPVIPFSVRHKLQESHKQHLIGLIICFIFHSFWTGLLQLS
jgi:hypothetical protein